MTNFSEQKLIKVKRTHPAAKLPTYGSTEAACFDLCIADGEWPNYTTGLAFEIPKGYYMEIHVRSSVGNKRDVRLANGVGIIDNDYRGDVKLCFTGTPAQFEPGERVAQGMLKFYKQWDFEEVSELSDTERGIGGIGSTGK